MSDERDARWGAYESCAAPDSPLAVEQVLPIAEFEAWCGILNPIVERETGGYVTWRQAARRLRQPLDFPSVVDLIDRAQIPVMNDGWPEAFEPPMTGCTDHNVWFHLRAVLPCDRFTVQLSYIDAPPRLRHLDGVERLQQFVLSRTPAPALWWCADGSLICATPMDTAITYIASSRAIIDAIQMPPGIETVRGDTTLESPANGSI